MLRDLRASMGNAVLLGDANSVGGSWGHLPDDADGIHAERCRPTNDTVNALQRLAQTRPGKIVECHFQTDNDGYFLDALAAFLIGAGDGHYFGFGFWDDIPSLGMDCLCLCTCIHLCVFVSVSLSLSLPFLLCL